MAKPNGVDYIEDFKAEKRYLEEELQEANDKNETNKISMSLLID